MTNTSAAAKASSQPSAGDKAPDFNLPTNGNGNVSLGKLAGKNVVLYFYPKDDTPGCTIEAKEFRDLNAEFGKNNTVIVGLSKDDVKSHDKFKEKYCLPFLLASDESGATCEAYGTWVEKSMYGKKYMGIERATFLIDPKGKIAKAWSKVKPEGHAQEVLDAVKALKN
jgi:thioredoxin-dependent peroxiredoxin